MAAKATWSPESSPQPDPLPAGEGTGNEGRWRAYDYKHLVARGKASLDIFRLRGESLSESDNLPAPEVTAREIVEDLEASWEQFHEIAVDLEVDAGVEPGSG